MDRLPQRRNSRRTLLQTAFATTSMQALPTDTRVPAVAATAEPAIPRASADLDMLFAELDDLVASRMAALRIPGAALGVITGEREHTVGLGVTNVDHPLPVDSNTLFQIGSTTKTFTGTALMRLVEQGRLELDAPVRTYLPDFRVANPRVSQEVRLWHLVTHTAGWSDGAGLAETGDGDDALARFVAGLADRPQIAPLGEYFSYNNGAVCLAGRVIEAVTGQTYEAAIADLVLAPLGLTQSFFFPEQIMTRAFAVGHDVAHHEPDAQPFVLEPWALPRAANPAGGLVASLSDELLYARFHLGDGTANGKRVLSAASVRRMQMPLGPGGSTPGMGAVRIDAIGVNWMLWSRGGVQIVSHPGGTNGQQSILTLVPANGLAVTLLTNAQIGLVLGFEVTDWVLERFLGLKTPSLATIRQDSGRLAEYVGEYGQADMAETIEIREVDGLLQLETASQLLAPGQQSLELPLRIVSADVAIADFLGLPLYADFVRNNAGEVAWVRFLGRLTPRLV